MQSLLLTEKEKDTLSQYKYSITDNSISTKYLKNFWNQLQTYFPNYVAPNVISITGLLVVLYACNLCYQYYALYPTSVGLCTILSILIYINLDAVDGIHARRTKNTSQLGELIDHGCDAIVTIFVGLIAGKILTDEISLWYLVHSLVLGFQLSHLVFLVKKDITFSKFFGPVECLIYFTILILLELLFGIKFLFTYINFRTVFGLILTANTSYIMLTVSKKDINTANGFMIIYTVYFLKSYFATNFTILTIISDAFTLSVITCDVMVSKMANKPLSQFTVMLALISTLNSIISICISTIFLLAYVHEISSYLNIPILTQIINVYCCGVFDLCHVGHIKMFSNALEFGNRLIVGVHSDQEVASYKRTPIMTHDERCNAVKHCKFVSQVLPNANLNITKEDIENNNIHYVVCSEEYFSVPDDKYYDVPRKMGILKQLPYCKEISTSDLIKRVKTRLSS